MEKSISLVFRIIPVLVGTLYSAGCSSVQQTDHQMTKEEIIDYYCSVLSSNLRLRWEFSEYSYRYCDTVYCFKRIAGSDSLFVLDEYDQLSVIQFLGIQHDCPFSADCLPPTIIEKKGMIFISGDYGEWGPDHNDVETEFRKRGFYVASSKRDPKVMEIPIYDSQKDVSFYFMKDNPRHYKKTRSNLSRNFSNPPKFKGVICNSQVIKAKSYLDLPHYGNLY